MQALVASVTTPHMQAFLMRMQQPSQVCVLGNGVVALTPSWVLQCTASVVRLAGYWSPQLLSQHPMLVRTLSSGLARV